MKDKRSTKFWIVLFLVSFLIFLCGFTLTIFFKNLRLKVPCLGLIYDFADENLFPQQNTLKDLVSSYFESSPESPKAADLDEKFWTDATAKLDAQIDSLEKDICEKEQELKELRKKVTDAQKDAEKIEEMGSGALFKEWLKPLHFILKIRKEILVTAKLAEELEDITERTNALMNFCNAQTRNVTKSTKDGEAFIEYTSVNLDAVAKAIKKGMKINKSALKLKPLEKGARQVKKLFDLIILQGEKSRQVHILESIISPKRLVHDLNEISSVISFFNEHYTLEPSTGRQEMLKEIQESQKIKVTPKTRDFIVAVDSRMTSVIEDTKTLAQIVFKTNENEPVPTESKTGIDESILRAINTALRPSTSKDKIEAVETLKKDIRQKNTDVQDLEDFDFSAFSGLTIQTVHNQFKLEDVPSN